MNHQQMADDKAQLVARNFLSHVHQLFYFIIYFRLLFYSIVKKYNKCLFFLQIAKYALWLLCLKLHPWLIFKLLHNYKFLVTVKVLTGNVH